MSLSSSSVLAVLATSTFVLALASSADTSLSQTVEMTTSAESSNASEPKLEEQLIKSLLRIRALEAQLRSAEQKMEELSATRPINEGAGADHASEYLPRNGREEVCVRSILQALRKQGAAVDWRLSCGDGLISQILAAKDVRQFSALTDEPASASGNSSSAPIPGSGSEGAVAVAPEGIVSKAAGPTEPFVILPGEDGKTPLMRQQREIVDMKGELLSADECLEAGKWLVDESKKDLLLFSFFAVDRGQVGRCVQTNSGWRFERAGPFDEGYVLKSNRKS